MDPFEYGLCVLYHGKLYESKAPTCMGIYIEDHRPQGNIQIYFR